MKFPFLICELDDESLEIYEKFYAKPFRDIKRNQFEGMWFRTQEEINKYASGWTNENDKRRRIVHFLDHYGLTYVSGKPWLCLEKTYLYLSVTLPKAELDDYQRRIESQLSTNNKRCRSINDCQCFLEDLVIELKRYNRHPMDEQECRDFPDEYETLDITVRSSNNFIDSYTYERPWKLFKKGIRTPEEKGNPKYIASAKEIVQHLPAQTELGCGLSIESNIPPLYSLHEIYRVQNHKSGKFYLGQNDDLVVSIVKEPDKRYSEFTYMIKSCILSKPNNAHSIIKQLFDMGYFVGEVLSNNFDMLCGRVGVKEKLLRAYEPEKFFPNIDFHPDAKSLICIGSHADRKKIQQQARAKGLKVIHIDTEGYYRDNEFFEYPLEGPKNDDLVYKASGTHALKELLDILTK